jgi:hypothetical protein
MRKTTVALIVVSLFALLMMTACTTQTEKAPARSGQNITIQGAKGPAEDASIKQGIAQEKCVVAGNAYERLKATMENPNEIIKMALSVNSYLDVKAGQCVIFPIAVRNEFLDDRNFFLSVEFESAKDRAPIEHTHCGQGRDERMDLAGRAWQRKNLAPPISCFSPEDKYRRQDNSS